MNLIRKLIGIEWIKLRRRSVFAVVAVVYTLIISFGLAIQQYMHSRNPNVAGFALPEDWLSLVEMSSSIGMLMLLIGVALLTSSESTWRTQRQNVIDGLSRAQYFSAKLLLVAMIAATLWIILPVIGIVTAAFGGVGREAGAAWAPDQLTLPALRDQRPRIDR